MDFSNNNLGEGMIVSGFMYVAKTARKTSQTSGLGIAHKNHHYSWNKVFGGFTLI